MASAFGARSERAVRRTGRALAALGCGLLGAIALAGCGPDADDYPLLRPDAGIPHGWTPEDGGGAQNWIEDDPLEDWDTTDAGPLSGIYAMELIVNVRAIVEVQARQLGRWRLLQHGRTVRMRSQICRLGMPSVPEVAELSIPLAVEKVLRAKDMEAEGEYLSAEEPEGAVLSPPELFTLLGAELADPKTDPLPTAESPAAALDEDEDGAPGVTLQATTVLCASPEVLYGAVRSSALLDGTVESADRIVGNADALLEQSVLGYSHDCLAAAAGLTIEILPGNTFQAVRVDMDLDVNEICNVTCGEIVLAAPTLFGAYWGDG